LSNFGWRFPANLIAATFKLGYCRIFEFRQCFLRYFAQNGAVISHLEYSPIQLRTPWLKSGQHLKLLLQPGLGKCRP
jgi:hypothetical protein